MSEEFSPKLLTAFGATRGAYSPVTRDEHNKSQITLVGPEQVLAEDFLGARLRNHHGNAADIRAAGYDPEVVFRLHPTGQKISLTLSYKTNKPRELRLYLRKDEFKPLPSLNWCIFIRDGELWIGQFGNWMRGELETGKMPEPGNRILPEAEIDEFQTAVNASPPSKVASTTMAWRRDPRVAALAMERAGYVCELEPKYPIFVSKGSGKPFMEAHHLIPMKVQSDFGVRSLDVEENICILNPLTHRKLHHAPLSDIASDLHRLMSRRQNFLQHLGLLEDDVLRLYD